MSHLFKRVCVRAASKPHVQAQSRKLQSSISTVFCAHTWKARVEYVEKVAESNFVEFRREVRKFLHENLTEDLRARVLGGFELTKEEFIEWQRKLLKKGWVAPTWPVEHGGLGWGVEQTYVFEEECALYGAPTVSPMGVGMVGSILISAGTEEQKKRFLGP